MLIFGSGMSTERALPRAVEEAVGAARSSFGEQAPKLAIVFGSRSYEDIAAAPDHVRALLGAEVEVVGGSAATCVLGPDSIARRGLSVVLLGGDGIEVATATAPIDGADHLGVVPAGEHIRRASERAAEQGLGHYACLVFAPGMYVDGEALVAAVRKGAGAHAQLAGCLTGDELEESRPAVFSADGLRSDRAVLVGVFTRKPVGIAARHGWHPVGPARTVTRANGTLLVELDNRPALDVWLEDAKRAGARPPGSRRGLAAYLANHYEIGIIDAGKDLPPGDLAAAGGEREVIARAPWSITRSGAIRLSGSIGEGRRVRIVHASRKDLLRASTDAAADAELRAGSQIAGALVLACSGRHAALGAEFPSEPLAIRERIKAPIGGACVFGEIAKSGRDADAFFNTTAVIVAFAA